MRDDPWQAQMLTPVRPSGYSDLPAMTDQLARDIADGANFVIANQINDFSDEVDAHNLSFFLAPEVLRKLNEKLTHEERKQAAFCVLHFLLDDDPIEPGGFSSQAVFIGGSVPRTRSEFALAWMSAFGVTRELATEYQEDCFADVKDGWGEPDDQQRAVRRLAALLKISNSPFEVNPLHPELAPPIEKFFRASNSGMDYLEKEVYLRRVFKLILKEVAPLKPPDWVSVTTEINLFPVIRGNGVMDKARQWVKAALKPPEISYPQTRIPLVHAMWEDLCGLLPFFPVIAELYGQQDADLVEQVRTGFLRFIGDEVLHRSHANRQTNSYWEAIGSGWLDAQTAQKLLTSTYMTYVNNPTVGEQSKLPRSFTDSIITLRVDNTGEALSRIQTLHRLGVDLLSPIEGFQHQDVAKPVYLSDTLLVTAAKACNDQLYAYLLSLGADPLKNDWHVDESGARVESPSANDIINSGLGILVDSVDFKEAHAKMKDITRVWCVRKAARDAIAEIDGMAANGFGRGVSLQS